MGVEYLGKYPDIDYSKLAKAIAKLKVIDTEEMYSIIFSLVNNNGAKLVAKNILENINE